MEVGLRILVVSCSARVTERDPRCTHDASLRARACRVTPVPIYGELTESAQEQTAPMDALGNLASCDDHQTAVVEAGGLPLIVKAMTEFPNSESV
eukprot:COSAG02_NODE_18204_length_953_cov_1.824356_2_plen_95_part_00